MKSFKELSFTTYNTLRGLHFLSQLRTLEWYAKNLSPRPLNTAKTNKALELKLFKSILEIFNQDAKDAAEGIFPYQLLGPEDIFSYWKNYPLTVWDSLQIHKRRTKQQAHDFSDEAKILSEDLPKYFVRNFHFQTDGYLSKASARVYDHQVEILFAGTAEPMRRMILRPLKKHLKDKVDVAITELACGTGAATRSLTFAFPDAKITATDLSLPYLELAKDRLKNQSHVSFLEADAASRDFPIESESQDAVVCVFLFHELPIEERKLVLQNAFNILKPGGLFVAVDSIQVDDIPDFNIFLEDFPKNYHEPFYKNYTLHPLEGLFNEAGFSEVTSRFGFLSKLVCGWKKIE